MDSSWQTLVGEHLWPHQREGLLLVERYLDAFAAPTSDVEGRAALIQMPTGTGKTAVLAVAAHLFPPAKNVLVLTPWDALADQLRRDLSLRLWQNIKVDPPSAKRAVRIFPSSVESVLGEDAAESLVLVATIATLQQAQAKRPAAYELLKNRIDLVLVDEGHYEPALRWARAIRGLRCPTVLLTATPYRNDLKFFAVHPGFIFRFSHGEAEHDHFIRSARVVDETFDRTSVSGFCDLLERHYAGLSKRFPDARAIVRCGSKRQVQDMTAELLARGHAALGVHDGFDSKSSPNLRKTVPPLDSEPNTTFWVHQDKMVEGLDDPSFRLLGVFEGFTTERAFVQQVGRVLRNPGRSVRQHAIIFGHPGDGLSAAWIAYRAFDEEVRAGKALTNIRDLVWNVPMAYVRGRYRKPLDPETPVHDAVVFPRSARVFGLEGDDRNLDKFAEIVVEEWETLDREIFLTDEPDGATKLFLYRELTFSPWLKDTAFQDSRLGLTVLRIEDDLLFFSDTGGRTPDAIRSLHTLGQGELQRLFLDGAWRLTSVILTNTDLSQHTSRRRSLHAFSVGGLAPDLGDHTHFVSTASGVGEGGARYVGFNTGRVREPGTLSSFAEYTAWLNDIADEVGDATRRGAALFDRFAETVAAPQSPEPRNVLLDLRDAVAGQFVESATSQSPGRPLAITDLACDVSTQGVGHAFTLNANDRDFPVKLRWDDKKACFQMASSELEQAFTTVSGGTDETLLDFINAEQAFRVIVEDQDAYIVYSQRRFYRPKLALWGRQAPARFDLLKILEPIDELGAIGVEKGVATAAGWPQDSVFGLIEGRFGNGGALHTELVNFEWLICDDLSTETADFLAFSPMRRHVVAIHAKAQTDAAQVAASALHVVGMQAIKNLAFLQPYNVRTASPAPRWNGLWQSTVPGLRRIRRPPGGTGALAWTELRALLSDPGAQREVWLVLGQTLSKHALEGEIQLKKPAPQTIQVLFSLQAIWGAASSVGCGVRVFCSP